MARIRSRVTGRERDLAGMSDTKRQHLLASGRWERIEEAEPDPEPDDLPPPRHGAGSSREAWADYAEKHGVTVTDDIGRDEIIAELESRGVRLFGELPDLG